MSGESEKTTGVLGERLAPSIEVKIEADKIRNTQLNAIDLLRDSVGFFGGEGTEKSSEIALRVLSRYGRSRPYTSFGDILISCNNSNGSKKVAEADKESMVDSVFIALNLSALGDGLVTDLASAEEIDSYLPQELNGIGKFIKDKNLSDQDKSDLLAVNDRIVVDGLFDSADDLIRADYYEKWEKKDSEKKGSVVRMYVETSRQRMKDIGIKEKSIAVELNKTLNKVTELRKDTFYTPEVSDKLASEDESDDERKKGRPWETTMTGAANAFMNMDHTLRWSRYQTPYWFDNLNPREFGYKGTDIAAERKRIQGRIHLMAIMNDAAAGLSYAGKDYDKILGNSDAFSFTREDMNTLFDHDFKMVVSKMVTDLCETYIDQNGIRSLRYKEKVYQFATDKEKENGLADSAGFLIRDERRVEMNDTVENSSRGARVIDQDVMEKIARIMDTKEGWAKWLAEQRGGGAEKVTELDRMNAATAWTMFFAMGDSSVADRMRILPTLGGIISDAMRTLNPDYKAKAKWQILKGGKIRKDDDLFDAEYFTGKVANYVIEVMRLEKDVGPIDGNEKLRDKIARGKVTVFPDKMYYGFFDFINGSRDLALEPGSTTTLAELAMNYAFEKDSKGNYTLPRKTVVDYRFNSKGEQNTFQNEFHDHLETASLVGKLITGKIKKEGLMSDYATDIKDKFGMVNGIKGGDGNRYLSYTTSPDLWAKIIQAAMGPDVNWLSSDFIPIIKTVSGISYNTYINDLVDSMGLTSIGINTHEVMRLLGSNIEVGKDPVKLGPLKLLKNYYSGEKNGKDTTLKLREKQRSTFSFGKDSASVSRFRSFYESTLKNKSSRSEYVTMSVNFERALTMGRLDVCERLSGEMRKFLAVE